MENLVVLTHSSVIKEHERYKVLRRIAKYASHQTVVVRIRPSKKCLVICDAALRDDIQMIKEFIDAGGFETGKYFFIADITFSQVQALLKKHLKPTKTVVKEIS